MSQLYYLDNIPVTQGKVGHQSQNRKEMNITGIVNEDPESSDL